MESTTKKAFSKAPAVPNLQPFTLKGIEYHIDGNGNIELLLPVAELPQFHGPLLSDELRDWSKEVNIAENIYCAAYDKAQSAFFAAIESATISEYISEHLTKN